MSDRQHCVPAFVRAPEARSVRAAAHRRTARLLMLPTSIPSPRTIGLPLTSSAVILSRQRTEQAMPLQQMLDTASCPQLLLLPPSTPTRTHSAQARSALWPLPACGLTRYIRS
ncbi:hypothetical protein IF2G_01636 [Cordyceps javanica]|nr:hypothetical protein IF2G_01636 [Cordyceps javanica]